MNHEIWSVCLTVMEDDPVAVRVADTTVPSPVTDR